VGSVSVSVLLQEFVRQWLNNKSSSFIFYVWFVFTTSQDHLPMTETTGIQFFSAEHFFIMAITAILCVVLPIYARRKLDRRSQEMILRWMSILIFSAITSAFIFRVSTGIFDWQKHIPLNLCNFLAVMLPFFFWKYRPRHLVEVCYFIITVGTLQGVITPNLSNSFPNLLYFTYWIVHSGLLLFIIYLVSVWRIYPRRISVVYSMLWITGYCVLMMIFNYTSGVNYMYLIEKPPHGSILDLLGPWPWYVFIALGVALVLSFISWLPFVKLSKEPTT